ncbi:hypothetical protein ASG01_14900 [Chryseobacterium sp. Leaf180]|nr:hypothetical protein ASG01_14900 [Chryseobacterium sp. Leaf180]
MVCFLVKQISYYMKFTLMIAIIGTKSIFFYIIKAIILKQNRFHFNSKKAGKLNFRPSYSVKIFFLKSISHIDIS